MNEVIDLFHKFKKYKNKSHKQLKEHLQPSITLNQHKKFFENNELTGFVSWAYLHNLVQDRFKETGKIKTSEWKSGNNLWLIDIVSIRNTFKMMRWVYNHFRKELIVNTSINWLRTDHKVYRFGEKFKRDFH